MQRKVKFFTKIGDTDKLDEEIKKLEKILLGEEIDD